jgi:carboxymethylenebutenolidase
MGNQLELRAGDGHRFSGYLAEPDGKPLGGIVVIQEIWGVTSHIRAVADQYAAAGYRAIAPALFDRQERAVDLPYADIQKAFGYMQAAGIDDAMLDLAAAVEHVSQAGRTGVVGFCWGGLLTFIAAARLKIDAAVSYYGGGIVRHLGEKPKVPIMFHFGDQDAHIPMSDVDQIKTAVPQGIYHVYPADHGFNCTDRASFEPKSAALAFQRTVEFLHAHVG